MKTKHTNTHFATVYGYTIRRMIRETFKVDRKISRLEWHTYKWEGDFIHGAVRTFDAKDNKVYVGEFLYDVVADNIDFKLVFCEDGK